MLTWSIGETMCASDVNRARNIIGHAYSVVRINSILNVLPTNSPSPTRHVSFPQRVIPPHVIARYPTSREEREGDEGEESWNSRTKDDASSWSTRRGKEKRSWAIEEIHDREGVNRDKLERRAPSTPENLVQHARAPSALLLLSSPLFFSFSPFHRGLSLDVGRFVPVCTCARVRSPGIVCIERPYQPISGNKIDPLPVMFRAGTFL